MKDFVVIVKSTAGKVDKFQDFDTRAEAETHVNGYDIKYFAIKGVEADEGKYIEAVEAAPARTEHVPGYGGFIVPNPGGETEYWIVDPVAETVTNDQTQADADLKMREWLADISETDASMPRFFEDYIDENGIVLADGRVKDSYETKKAIRVRMPS